MRILTPQIVYMSRRMKGIKNFLLSIIRRHHIILSVIVFLIYIVLIYQSDVSSLFTASAILPADLDSYYSSVRSALSGNDPYSDAIYHTSGPPLVLLFYLPFAFLSPAAARIVLTCLNLLGGALSCFLIAKKMWPKYTLLATSVLSVILF